MKEFEIFDRIEKINLLIELGITGTPSALAEHLDVSRSTVFSTIKIMKELCKAPIKYDARRKTYYYTVKGKLELGYQRLSYDELYALCDLIGIQYDPNLN